MSRELISREECKKIQVELLDILDRVCNEHGIKYYLAYGTLLGAVRHKGFIPWDDDIDVFLMRDEYEQLMVVLKREFEKDKTVLVLDGENKNYYYPFAKLVNRQTMAKMEDNLTAHGVWIDIFPMDAVPEDDRKCERFLSKCVLFRAIILSMTTDFHSQKLGKKFFPKKILSIVASCVGKDRIYKSYVKYIKQYDIKKEKYVACLSSPYIKKEKIEKNRLIPQKDFEFEGKYFKGPEQWDLYLRRIYGNYMELPPEEKRRIHSITAWRV